MRKYDSYWDLKKKDFPKGEPVLKMKRGIWYRPENNGYTQSLLEAGLYRREEALEYCFDSKGKNGHCGVCAVPLREALKHNYYSHERIKRYKGRLDLLLKYVEKKEEYDTVIF